MQAAYTASLRLAKRRLDGCSPARFAPRTCTVVSILLEAQAVQDEKPTSWLYGRLMLYTERLYPDMLTDVAHAASLQPAELPGTAACGRTPYPVVL